jgi:hypothetical protein
VQLSSLYFAHNSEKVQDAFGGGGEPFIAQGFQLDGVQILRQPDALDSEVFVLDDSCKPPLHGLLV